MLINLLLKQDYCYLKWPSEALKIVEAEVALQAEVGVEERVLGVDVVLLEDESLVENQDLKRILHGILEIKTN